jgi:hypothetical protein
VQQQQVYLKNAPFHFIAPDGQPGLETEFGEIAGSGHLQVALRALFAADPRYGPVRKPEPFA